MSGRCCAYFLPNTETGCFGRENLNKKALVQALKWTRGRAKHFVGTVLWGLWSGKQRNIAFFSKEEAIQRLREIYSLPSGVCKVVGLNSLVRQFGLRFHCNGIKQLAKDFLKACPAFHGILPFLPCPLHYALSAPRAHLNGYRLILLISPLAGSGHCKRSPISLSYPIRHASSGKVTLQHFPSRTLFGTQQVRGKQRTVFLT